MMIAFYIAAAIASISSLIVVTRKNALVALLYMIVSLASLSFIFYLLGSPFVAVLEIVIYAGAIMVLFVFVIMMLNLGRESVKQEKTWMTSKTWLGPSILSAILLVELIWVLTISGGEATAFQNSTPKDVGIELFGPYIIATELAAMLLIAGIIGAYHLGKKRNIIYHRFTKGDS